MTACIALPAHSSNLTKSVTAYIGLTMLLPMSMAKLLTYQLAIIIITLALIRLCGFLRQLAIAIGNSNYFEIFVVIEYLKKFDAIICFGKYFITRYI